MKLYKLKLLSLALVLVVTAGLFAACSGTENTSDESSESSSLQESGNTAETPDNSVIAPKKKDNTLTPDIDSVQLAPASSKSVSCASEDECIEVLARFANPTGNEYDALSVLGGFRYANKSEEDMMAGLKTASDTWHKAITEKVGEKCVVHMTLREKTPIDLADARVAEWNSANGKTAEAYTNVKCSISTNYVNNQVTISFDLVKLDGSWYLANMSTLGKIQNVITNELYI